MEIRAYGLPTRSQQDIAFKVNNGERHRGQLIQLFNQGLNCIQIHDVGQREVLQVALGRENILQFLADQLFALPEFLGTRFDARLQLMVQCRYLFLGLLQIFNVRTGTHPLSNRALIVARGNTLDQKPAVAAVPRAQATVNSVVIAGLRRHDSRLSTPAPCRRDGKACPNPCRSSPPG